MYKSLSPLLLSRAAEAAYWAGRYLERAEGTARLIKTHTGLTIDLPESASVGWGPLLAVVGFDPAFTGRNPNATEEVVVGHLASDPSNVGSIRSSVTAVHHNLRVTRSFMPVEAAEVLTELHLYVQANADLAIDRWTRGPFLNTVIRGCQTLTGVLSEGMSHDDAYFFFTIGRRMERADLVARVIDVHSSLLTGNPIDGLGPYRELCWTSALRSVSGLQSFRRRGVPSTIGEVVAFLLHDQSCPRTVASSLDLVASLLHELPEPEAALQICGDITLQIESADVESLGNGVMHGFADDIQAAISRLHVAIEDTWFQPIHAAIESDLP